MLITLLGSVGIGLVWGWLLGSLGGRIRRPLVVGWSTSLATLLAAAVTLMFADRRGLWFFLGATALSLLLHLAWRQELRRRFGVSK
jgi:hypothetical protein